MCVERDSYLFQCAGLYIAFDPMLKNASDFPIDLVIINHSHMKRLDWRTVSHLPDKAIWIVPCGMKSRLFSLGATHVLEMNAWESCVLSFAKCRDVSLGVSALSDEGNGWGLRFEKEEKVIKQLYFVGCVDYNPRHLNEIGEAFGSFDVSVIPVAKRGFLGKMWPQPEAALQLHREVHSRLTLGTGAKNARLLDALINASKKYHVEEEAFQILQPGQVINW